MLYFSFETDDNKSVVWFEYNHIKAQCLRSYYTGPDFALSIFMIRKSLNIIFP